VTSDQTGSPELPDTHREIGQRRLPEGEVHTVLIRRHYDAPAAEWFEFTPEVVAQADRIGQAWAEIVATAGLDRSGRLAN
jgi:hypothetical protein